MSSNKRIVLIHGVGVKPPQAEYQELWLAALRHGLQRDFPKLLECFDLATKDFVYFGDLTNQQAKQPWDATIDLEDRKLALAALQQLRKTKHFKRDGYEKLPKQSPLKEFAADVAAPITHGLGLGKLVKGNVVPELGAYWRNQDGYATALDERVVGALRGALQSQADLLVISHCLGSVAAYNAFWQLSQEVGQQQDIHGAKCNLWLTLGSPLADETVKHELAGWRGALAERFPGNLVRWANLAAEDDFFCHDETVANDFKQMLSQHKISGIVDYGIYNLALRFGRSDPHHSAGYLVHPRTSKLISEWLAAS